MPCMNGAEGDHGALRRSVGWTGGTAVPGRRGASACRGIHRQARYRSWHRGGAGPRLGRGARAWLGLRRKPAELAGRVRQDSARREPRRILVAIGRHQRADLDRRDQPGGSAVRVRAGVHGGAPASGRLAQPNQSRRALSAGWAQRVSRGSWCSTTCRTRRTWMACGRRAGRAGCWSPAGSPRSSPVGPGCGSSRWVL